MKTQFLIYLLFLFPVYLLAQEDDIYNESVPISERDIIEALDFIGLKIHNFKLLLPTDGKFKLVFYKNNNHVFFKKN